jgi:hypothetical protein
MGTSLPHCEQHLIFCRSCGYDLSRTGEHRCPECGRRFDPEIRRTFATSRWRHKVPWIVKAAAWLLLSLAFTACVLLLILWLNWRADGAAIKQIATHGSDIHGDRLDTFVVGPPWARSILGRRWGFLLQRAGPACVLGEVTTDEDLRLLSRCCGLRVISLTSGARVTDKGLEHIKELHQLEGLCLEDCSISDLGLAYLGNMSTLHVIDLCRTHTTDAGLRTFHHLDHLKAAYLFGTEITDSGVEYLTQFSSLQELSLGNYIPAASSTYPVGTRSIRGRITDVGLKDISRLSNLDSLELMATDITDEGLTYISTLPRLRYLSLRGCKITDAGLPSLRLCTSLRNVDVRDTLVTQRGKQMLKKMLARNTAGN